MSLGFRRLDGYEVTITRYTVRRWWVSAYDPRHGVLTTWLDINPNIPDTDKLREACYVVGDEVERLGAESHEWGAVAEEIR